MTKNEVNASKPTDGLTVRFKISGSLKRSTLERDHPDPEWERLTDAQWWTFCTRLQAERLGDSLRSEFPIGSTLYWISRKLFATTSYDLHCLLVAGGNLERAIQRLKNRDLDGFRPIRRSRRALQLLRNVHEHWDELRRGYRHGQLTGAARKLEVEYPGAEPWCLAIQPDGDVVVANTISLQTLNRDLRTFEARIWWELRALRRSGRNKASKLPPNQAPAPAGSRRR